MTRGDDRSPHIVSVFHGVHPQLVCAGGLVTLTKEGLTDSVSARLNELNHKKKNFGSNILILFWFVIEIQVDLDTFSMTF